MVKRPIETLACFLVLILGLGLRLAWTFRFPIIPHADFHNLIYFGTWLRDYGLTDKTAPWNWQSFNFGLPLALCGLFHLFPKADTDTIARFATVTITGLAPLLPFLLWRGILSLRVRVLAGVLLALWPGQLMFSGAVAQDNWTIFPTIALGSLAVRALADGKPAWPVTAGLMYAAAAAMRADMLLILPLLLAAIRIDLYRTRVRQVAAGVLATIIGLLGLASYRYAASGRFALSPQIGGLAILGSYLPGSSYSGWVAPYAYLSWYRPEILRNREALLTQTAALGVREAMRRPSFHALRIAAMAGVYAVDGESKDPLFGSLEDPESLPAPLHERAAALADELRLPLRIEMALIQGLFFAAIVVGFRRRSWIILIPAAAILLKYVFHIFGVFQGRYFMAATGLELLTIAVAVEEVLTAEFAARRSLLVRSLAAGAAFGLVLWTIPPRMLAYVQSLDIDPQQHTYHIFLESPDHYAQLNCTMGQGTLIQYDAGREATLRTFQGQSPAPGDKAVAECLLTGKGTPQPLVLQVNDPFDPGGKEGRMAQRVQVDGEEVFYHDVGKEPGSGWANVPLGNVGAGTKKKVTIEVDAIHPEPGGNWPWNSRTGLQLARPTSVVHLAMGRPTAQSSNTVGYAGGSRSAADGETDGDFYHGSVTATGLDPNAWWQVDLGSSKAVSSIVIWNRTDCCPSRLSDYWVFLSDTPFQPGDTPATLGKRAGTWSSHQTSAPGPSVSIDTGGAKGRYVRVQLSGTDYLSLAEVQVFGH